jgi:deoxyribodipyrimidine photolyase-related protein
MVESIAKLQQKRWHRQRAHFIISAMRHFADDCRRRGFEVDYRFAPTLARGLRDHVAEYQPDAVIAMECMSRSGNEMLARCGVELLPNNQFLCHPSEFARWASGRKQFTMEHFYRWQRTRLDVLMVDGQPEGGRWNFDADNREPPPKDGRNHWPEPPRDPLDEIDLEVLDHLATASVWGAPPDGTWATTRAGALARLGHFIRSVLPSFGPHEDAMPSASWHVAHSLLAHYLNVGLLHPGELVAAAEDAYRRGEVPIASVEGFVRQVIGWREYVWGLYWLWGPDYGASNSLGAERPLPPVFKGAPTQMRCVAHTLQGVRDRAWAHHIQRLMVIGNLALIAGVNPQELTDWMWSSFIDGAEWVMVPNVVGMALHADGGRMATKPYAAGGAYISRMSDHCKGCAFDRTKRVGADACPFTTLYWDFLARHADRFARNPRIVQQVRAAQRLTDLDAVRERAVEVLRRLDRGEL